MEEKKCKDRVADELAREIGTLTELWESYQRGEDSTTGDGEFTSAGENIFDHGLSFDYVAPGTFGEDQERGYFRYQISWGGPSDEFRFYCDELRNPYRVEYWFMDWFDGAHVVLTGSELALLLEIFDWFKEAGSVEAEMEKALNE